MDIPEGWPTKEMQAVGNCIAATYGVTCAVPVFKAMLSVAPTPPAATWRTNGDTCLNCGKRITQHEDQTFCPTPPGVEPVYQVRLRGNKGWSDTPHQGYDSYGGHDEYERRKLYTSPPSPADDESGGTVEELRHAVTVAQLDKLQLEEELISLKAADDELRKAAEEAYEVLVKLAKDIELEGEEPEIIDNLRAALNKVQS